MARSLEVLFVEKVFNERFYKRTKEEQAEWLLKIDDKTLTEFAEKLPQYGQELWEEVLSEKNLKPVNRPDIEKVKKALLDKAQKILSTRSNT